MKATIKAMSEKYELNGIVGELSHVRANKHTVVIGNTYNQSFKDRFEAIDQFYLNFFDQLGQTACEHILLNSKARTFITNKMLFNDDQEYLASFMHNQTVYILTVQWDKDDNETYHVTAAQRGTSLVDCNKHGEPFETLQQAVHFIVNQLKEIEDD